MSALEGLRRFFEKAQRSLAETGAEVAPERAGEDAGVLSLLVTVSESFVIYYERSKRRLCFVDIRNALLSEKVDIGKSRAFEIPTDYPLCENDSVLSVKLSLGQRLLLLRGKRTLQIVEVRPERLQALASGRPISPLTVLSVGNFGADDELEILQADWHPHSDGHLLTLSSDDRLRVYDTVRSLDNEEQKFLIEPCGGARPQAFAFGNTKAWNWFTIFILDSNGAMYILCPVVPFGCHMPGRVIDELIFSETRAFEQESGRVERGLLGRTAAGVFPNRKLDFSTPTDGQQADPTIGTNSKSIQKRLEWLKQSFANGIHCSPNDVLAIKPLSSRNPSLQGPFHLQAKAGTIHAGIHVVDTSPQGPLVFAVPALYSEINIFILLSDVLPVWEDSWAPQKIGCGSGSNEIIHYESIKIAETKSKLSIIAANSRTSFCNELLVVCCGSKGFTVMMPWVADLASGELERISRSLPSSVTCIVETNSDSQVGFLGGDCLFLHPVGLTTLMLTAGGRIEVLGDRGTAKSLSAGTDSGSLATRAIDSIYRESERPRKVSTSELESILENIPVAPPHLSLDKLTSMNAAELYRLVDDRLSTFREGHVQGLVRALAVVQTTASAQIARLEEQKCQIQEFQEMLGATEVRRVALAAKRAQAETGMKILTDRLEKLTSRVQASNSVLSEEERAFKERFVERSSEVARLSRHAERVRRFSATRLQRPRLQATSELREVDKRRIHAALVQNGNALATLLDETARLATKVAQLQE